MPKRQLSPTEAFELRQALHIVTLDALVKSRRWAPGELIFQGGSSLHLAHGSPRFSEDLDFLVDNSLDLSTLSSQLHARLRDLPWIPRGLTLSTTKAKSEKNPHAFNLTLSGKNVLGSVRVKVELWGTAREVIEQVTAKVTPVALASGIAAGARAQVPTATTDEILVDKVFALAARPYLKPRDVFDLYWLTAQQPVPELSAQALQVRLDTYPGSTPHNWLESADARLDELDEQAAQIAQGIALWLPQSWPMDPHDASAMIEAAKAQLQIGIDRMREVADLMRDQPTASALSPRPGR